MAIFEGSAVALVLPMFDNGDIDYDQCFFDYPNYVRQNHLQGF